MNLEQLSKDRELAYKTYSVLQQSIKDHAKLFLQIGYLLNQINQNDLYRYIGDGGFETFEEFLNNPEIGFRPSTARLYMRVYSYYVEKLKLDKDYIVEIPLNRLMRLLPKLKAKTDDEAIITVEEVKPLTSYDFDTYIREAKLETNRPLLYKDKDTGKYIFEFKPEQMQKIINTEDNSVLFIAEE